MTYSVTYSVTASSIELVLYMGFLFLAPKVAQ